MSPGNDLAARGTAYLVMVERLNPPLHLQGRGTARSAAERLYYGLTRLL
jgi:hypothetical protein